MSTFLKKVFVVAHYGGRVTDGITSGVIDNTGIASPAYVSKMHLHVNIKPSVHVAPEADHDVMRRSLVNQIAMEVYGDVRVRLDEYINERLMDGDGRDELIAIREMME